jgi:threonine/homoserine/homoserine lactone efflux protein
LLATSVDGRKNSLGYLAGVTLATTLGVTIAYALTRLVESDSSGDDSGTTAIDYLIVVLLVFLVVRVFLRRKNTEPPKWMGRLQSATPGFSFKLGFLLFIAMPTDIITMITVGSYLAEHDAAWWRSVPFILLTALLCALPLLMLLMLGRRAQVLLPKARDWMTSNSWIISEAVILFFLAITVNGLR